VRLWWKRQNGFLRNLPAFFTIELSFESLLEFCVTGLGVAAAAAAGRGEGLDIEFEGVVDFWLVGEA